MKNTYKFPNELCSNEEKNSFEFGKKYAEAIWNEWEHKLTKNKIEFEENRKYAIGKHPIDICKNNIKGKYINETFLHIDWNDKINILPKLLRKVYNSVDMKEFSPIVYALDPSAREEKSKKKNEKLDLFYSKDFIQQLAQSNGGFSDIPLDKIPESEEQVELEEVTEGPLSLETAEELVLQSVCNENDFSLIQNEILRDIVECGLGAVHLETCKVDGIKMRRIEPEKFIHSKSNSKYFKNSHFFGEERYLTISQLRNIAASSKIGLSDEDIRKMMFETFNEDIDEDKTVIRVLSYAFKTHHETVLKKKNIYSKKIGRLTNAITIIDRTEDVGTENEYKPNPNYKSDRSEKITETFEVWYEGIMVLEGDRKLIRHRLIENMPEHEGKIPPPFIAMAPRISKEGYNSIVSEVKARINSIQELRYRIVHHRNRLKGTIAEIDFDMIANVTLGNKKLTPEEVLSFYFSLDLAFRKTIDEEGEYINGNRPVTEVPTAIPYALRELMVQFVEDIKLLDESFGYIGFDQQRPDEKTLFDGEIYRLSDNVQMKDYSDCLHQWSVNILQVISSRINDIFKWSNIKEKYINMIGTDDVDILEKYKNRASHYFGIFQDIVPTRQERMTLINNVNQYVTQGLLDPLDGEEILNIRNKKIALRILRLKLDKRKKETNEFELQKSREMSNGNIQASRVSAEEKRTTLQLEAQLKQQMEVMKFEMDMKRMEADGLLKIQDQKQRDDFKASMERMRQEFNAQLTQLKKDRDEDSRLKAIDKSAYNQQQLIKLRNGEISDINESPMQSEINLSNTI